MYNALNLPSEQEQISTLDNRFFFCHCWHILVLAIEPWTSYTLGKCSTAELHSRPLEERFRKESLTLLLFLTATQFPGALSCQA